MPIQLVLPQFRGSDRANIVTEADEPRRPDQTLQRNFVDRLSIIEEMPGCISVSAGV